MGLAVISPRDPLNSPLISNRHDSPLQGMVEVDEEENFYCPSSSKKPMVLTSVLSSLRGGDLCVDSEGNLYTPRKKVAARATSSSNKLTTVHDIPIASDERLRGGSQNHNIGGLCVDSEGNFFAVDGRSLYTKKALQSLRGGSLCVDNEGNFYTHPSCLNTNVQALASGNSRRRMNCDPSSVVLTKNRSKKKNSTKCKKSARDDHMTFIGYNNALMET